MRNLYEIHRNYNKEPMGNQSLNLNIKLNTQ